MFRTQFYLAFLCIAGLTAAQGEAPPVIVVVFDGLRPDYVTPELMPRLHAFGEAGVVCENHHSVFPTVTRVNSSTFATGAYPSGHGILGNTIYIPEASTEKTFNTGSAGDLMKVRDAVGGQLLTVPTTGEILAEAGKSVVACSAGSSGSAFLLNYKVPKGALLHYGTILPESLASHVIDVLGPVPDDATPNAGRNARAIDAYFRIAVPEFHPALTYIWISDPDHTAHEMDMGHPKTQKSIQLADGEFGRLLDGLAERNIVANIIVTSDHGFSSYIGGKPAVAPLLQAGLKRNLSSTDVVLADGAIYVNEGGDEKVRQIVDAYQKTDGIGAIFTAAKEPGSPEGVVPGTLSFDVIHWAHPRSGQILIDAEWTNDTNAYGYQGATRLSGEGGGHGTSSPWDVHNTLIAGGPAFKKQFVSKTPSGNVDVAAMIYQLTDVSPPPTVDGRVLDEILAGGPDALPVDASSHTVTHEWDGGTYTLTLHTSTVAGKNYVDYTETVRTLIE